MVLCYSSPSWGRNLLKSPPEDSQQVQEQIINCAPGHRQGLWQVVNKLQDKLLVTWEGYSKTEEEQTRQSPRKDNVICKMSADWYKCQSEFKMKVSCSQLPLQRPSLPLTCTSIKLRFTRWSFQPHFHHIIFSLKMLLRESFANTPIPTFSLMQLHKEA